MRRTTPRRERVAADTSSLKVRVGLLPLAGIIARRGDNFRRVTILGVQTGCSDSGGCSRMRGMLRPIGTDALPRQFGLFEPSSSIIPGAATTFGVEIDETSRSFTLWAFETLKFRVETLDDRIYTLYAPTEGEALFNGVGRVRFAFQPQLDPSIEGVEYVRPGSPMFEWMLDQMRSSARVTHAAPRQQPAGVHEIARELLAAYQVDGGTVHLAGCTLEDRPFLRLSFRHPDRLGQPALQHLFLTPDGTVAAAELVMELGLEALSPYAGRPPELLEADLQRWVAVGELHARRTLTDQLEMISAAVVWCTYAAGKLAFSIGPETVETPFEGWAQLIVTGRIHAPPYSCPLSGTQSFHLAATGDGRVTAAEAIGTCDVSQQRALSTELETCALTGGRMLSRYLSTCPVTGSRIQQSRMVTCAMCHQQASPTAIKRKLCLACRSLQSIRKDDPRMARILGEYQKLDRWRGWKMAETAVAYVLTATALTRCLLLVLDKESLQPCHSATGSRVFGQWTETSDVEQKQILF